MSSKLCWTLPPPGITSLSLSLSPWKLVTKTCSPYHRVSPFFHLKAAAHENVTIILYTLCDWAQVGVYPFDPPETVTNSASSFRKRSFAYSFWYSEQWRKFHLHCFNHLPPSFVLLFSVFLARKLNLLFSLKTLWCSGLFFFGVTN